MNKKYYALAVRQPWASMIATGRKTIEVRSRPWRYTGPLIICASAKPRIRLNSGHDLPTGAAIGLVEMTDCRLLRRDDLAAAGMTRGHWADVKGAWAWCLADAREIEPIPGKWIVAPWPWRGPEPVLSPGYHSNLGF